MATIDHWLRENAASFPEKTALNFLGAQHVRYSYPDLVQIVDKTAAVLQHQLGVKRGDRIAFYGKNSDDELALLFAAAALGAIFVPLNWRLAPRELHYICKNAGISALFFDATFAEYVANILKGEDQVHRVCTGTTVPDKYQSLARMRGEQEFNAVLGEAAIDDPLLIVYTSGTTGRPKGAIHTQRTVSANALASIDAFDLVEEDHILTFLPLFHVGGINIQTLPTLLVAGTVTLAEQFSPEIFVHGVEKARISSVTVVPTILRALLGLKEWPTMDISSLKCMAIGSTDVPTELVDAVHSKNVPVLQVYGATETGPVTIYQKRDDAFQTVGSIGKAGLNTSVRLVAGGYEVAKGEPGEIWVKAPNCFIGYWDNEAETLQAFEGGWFKTGDIASQDEDGNFWFCDRSKNIIISGGENIYPAEVERIISQHAGVNEVAVVGRPDIRWGEVPVAIVSAAHGIKEADILLLLEGRIAKFKRPKSVMFVDNFPKNALGKIQHTELKKMLSASFV